MRTLPLLLALSCRDPAPEPVDSTHPDSPPADDSAADSGTPAPTSGSWSFGDDTVTVAVADPDAPLRSYTLTSTHPLRGAGAPADGTLVVTEREGQPRLRSTHLLLDALFALAVQEAAEASVEVLSDSAFASGADLPCSCYQTGEEWTWVWTRDLAYASDLGLAWLDASRARRSLAFKLSRPKDGIGDPTLVQDTGTGGSWPVSTDRVVWALGAQRLLAVLPEAERAAFGSVAYTSLAATLTEDRAVAWDPVSGLYRGESSFLDWREQSYPPWTATDLTWIAESRALSTNVLHLVALELASELSPEAGAADTWRAWAEDLRAAIHAAFWDEASGQWGSVLPAGLDPGPAQRTDALGMALAALHLGQPAAADRALAAYPHGPWGPPVIWPQQPDTAIYHNRAVWPFVTAYVAQAAAERGHGPLVALNLEALVAGAALNLSHMENLEWSTGANRYEDGAWTGPVVNSRRQIWSVAGYVGAMVQTLAGVQASAEGLAFAPAVPASWVGPWLQPGGTFTLHDLPWRGQTFDLSLELPAKGGEGLLSVQERQVNGAVVGAEPLDTTALPAGATVRVRLAAGSGGSAAYTTADPTASVAPPTPTLQEVAWAEGAASLRWEGAEGLRYELWRDGALLAQDLSATEASDPGVDPAAAAPCYTVRALDPATGLRSWRSAPLCLWGAAGERVQAWTAYALANEGGGWSTEHGQAHIGGWGDPEHTVSVYGLRVASDGEHALQLLYSNGGPLSTGITAGLKRVVITDDATGATVADAVVVMPHTGAWDRWAESTLLHLTLSAGQQLTVRVSDQPQMSNLGHYLLYTGGEGGGDSPFNRVNLAGLRLLALDGAAGAPAGGDTVPFDGVNDIDKLSVDQVLTPGAPLESWSRVGLTWDEGWLYLAVNTSAFEDPWAPFVLYLEPDPGAAAAGVGLEYGGLTPGLPFTPTLAITLRATSDAGDGAGPWAGLWQADGAGGFTQLRRWEPGVDLWQDTHTLALRVPWGLLGRPTTLRLAGHLVWGVPGAEWKLLVPAGHTPWTSDGGTAYTLDLGADPAAGGWVEG